MLGEKSENIMKKADPVDAFHISDVKIKCFYGVVVWPEWDDAEPALMRRAQQFPTPVDRILFHPLPCLLSVSLRGGQCVNLA